jgi:hypothetical protein
MDQFLDLAYYKHNNGTLPLYLSPVKDHKENFALDGFYEDLVSLATSEYGQTLYRLFKSDKDKIVLSEYAEKHGHFLEKFFQRELSINVKRKIFEDKIDLKQYYPLYCTRYNFGSYEKVERYLPQNFALDFYKVSMYNLNNANIYSIVKNWFQRQSTFRHCEICGKEYRPAFFRDWVYFGAAGNLSVCFECPTNTIPSEEAILKLIPQLVEDCGFIPNADFNPINFNFSSKVKSNDWTPTVKTIFQIGDWRKYFDSWFKALVKSKVLKDNILVTHRGVKCIAKSGNECNSLDELFIDNWLFDNGFQATKEPVYPKHEKYNSSGKRRADWLVNGYFIEYFGLTGEEAYDKKVIEKMYLVRELNLKMIALFPKDLSSIAQVLSVLGQ